MQYKDFIKPDEGFQYSINLQYDLNKLEKISSYIPTKASVEILEEYLKSIYYESKDRNTVLIGPYGKGKSHLILILMAIVSLMDDVTDEKNRIDAKYVIDKLINRIKNVKEPVSEMIKQIREQNKPLIPIIVNSNYIDIKQGFLMALRAALERENLLELVPNTYFDAVINAVEMWRNEYKIAYETFKDKLKEYGLNIKGFNAKIKGYDEETYKIFAEIYPQITSGTEFNPMLNSNVVKLYEEVNLKICETGKYSGMIITFDEFSKFLEGSTIRNVANDLKLIQDFGELAARSGKNQIHFICITHKAINDYLRRFPKEKVSDWRTVEGRFKEIYYTSSSIQNYELISNAIVKDREVFNNFIEVNKNEIDKISLECGRLALFNDIPSFRETIIKGCFPLNPIAAYVLPRISEKVAQNERTLFTFLAKDDKGSLVRFINKQEADMSLLSIDWIYDYFQILFRKEVFNYTVHETWLKAYKCLEKLSDKVERKIVKALAIIYIVNELDKLPPIDVVLSASLNLNRETYNIAINSLVRKHILAKNRSNNMYRFTLNSSINIDKYIEKVKETKLSKVNIKQALEQIIDLGYTLPKRYNDDYDMIRFFKNTFITFNQLISIDNAESIFEEYKADGVILHLLYDNELEKQQAVKKLQELNSKRILLCIPNKAFDKQEEIKEYMAVQILKNNEEFINSDEYALQELNLFEEDLATGINNYVNMMFHVQYNNCKYYDYMRELDEIKKPAHISKKVSQICETIFNLTPKINNEMINKMKISSPIVNARNKIIKYIFEGFDDSKVAKLEGKGPEVTIFRSTIENKGLVESKSSNNDKELNTVLHKIELFILSCEENRNSFSKIYNDLYGEGYGLRAGIIPIYLALKMKDFKENIVIYFEDKEIPLTAEVLSRINDTPDRYYLRIEKGTNEKLKYMTDLDKLFKNYRSNKVVGYNRFGILVEAMQNWIHSLPKYTRSSEKIFDSDNFKDMDLETRKFRKEVLNFDINPREFLFDIVRKKIFHQDSFDENYIRIQHIKDKLDKHLLKVEEFLIYKTKSIFDDDINRSLCSILRSWYGELPVYKKNHLFDKITNDFLNYMSDIPTYDENAIIKKLAYIVIGIDIESWNDDVLETYCSKITEIKDKVINYQDETAVSGKKSYEIVFYANNKKIEKSFEEEEVSDIGNALLNDIEQSIDEFGNSISTNEKRNIIMKLMEKFM